MIPYPLQIVKQLLTELHREAEMKRLSRGADQKKPSWIKRIISIAIAIVTSVIPF
jgi:preprotein translocase subunit SecY